MAPDLTTIHGDVQRRIREYIARIALGLWAATRYNAPDVKPFLARLIPMILGAQGAAAHMTEAYLARFLGVPYIGIPAALVTGAAARNGTPPEEVYRRAFVQMWAALGDGVAWEDARQQGANRVESSAETDVQLSSRAMFGRAQDYYPQIFGYERVHSPDACEFCVSVSGVYVKSAFAMPLHNRCGCTLRPLTEPHPAAKFLPSGERVAERYAVREHGELGPVLADPHDHFTEAPV